MPGRSFSARITIDNAVILSEAKDLSAQIHASSATKAGLAPEPRRLYNSERANAFTLRKGSAMTDITRLFQAFLAPALFVSATSLLILSINVRLMGIVSRLRQFIHAKHDAAKNDRLQEAEAYTSQITAIEKRAAMIQRCFLLVLISLAGTIASCLLLGFGLYWQHAALAAAVVFVLAMISLLAGTYYYIREVFVALSSVRDEARDVRFMDLGPLPEIRNHHPL
jgi:uncharacterized protein DUF2721